MVPGYPRLPGPEHPVPVAALPPPTRSGTRFQILRPGCNPSLYEETGLCGGTDPYVGLIILILRVV